MCCYLNYSLFIVLLTFQALVWPNHGLYGLGQPVIPEDYYIKNLILAENKGCNIEQNELYKQTHATFDSCRNKTLPSAIIEDIFTSREYFLCIAYYEALYSLCEVKATSFLKIEDAQNSDKVCKLFKDVFVEFNPEYKGTIIKSWSDYVKKSMSNETLCSTICVFGKVVNSRCTLIIELLNFYHDLKQENAKKNVVTNSNIPENPLNEVLNENGPQPSFSEKINQPDIQMDQTNGSPGEEVNLSKQIVNTKVNNSEAATAEKVEPVIQSIMLEKSPKPSILSNENNPHTIPTSNSLQTQQQLEKETFNPPNVETDSAVEKTDAVQEGLAPSNEKEQLQSDEDTKLIGSKDDDVLNELKVGDQDNIENNIGGLSRGFRDNFKETEDSNFFVYFLVMTGGCIVAYVLFHNRNKLVALALEGRKGRSGRARGGNRHTSANYSKLHSNLEEAIASNTTTPTATNVLY